jgi:hypothetical protein
MIALPTVPGMIEGAAAPIGLLGTVELGTVGLGKVLGGKVLGAVLGGNGVKPVG